MALTTLGQYVTSIPHFTKVFKSTNYSLVTLLFTDDNARRLIDINETFDANTA